MASGRLTPAGFVWTAVLALAIGVPVRADRLVRANQKGTPAQAASADADARAQAAQAQALVRLADAAMMGKPAPSDFPIAFRNDFLRAQGGRVWVPITLTIDPAKLSNPTADPVMLYLRVAAAGTTAPPAPVSKDAGKNGKKDKKKDKKGDKAAATPASVYPVEDVSVLDAQAAAAGQPIRLMRGFSVPPGKYDVYVVVQERGGSEAAKTAVLKQPLDVPDYTAAFSTSSVIVAEGTKQLPAPITPDQQAEHPYSFGSTQIVVSPDRAFRKSQELVVLMQIYNPTITPDKKFDVETTYTFYKEAAGGETRFNATAPQIFTPETMGAAFNPSAADRSIQAGQGVPLDSFPEGAYRLEITVTDKSASPAKVLTQSVHFTVSS